MKSLYTVLALMIVLAGLLWAQSFIKTSALTVGGPTFTTDHSCNENTPIGGSTSGQLRWGINGQCTFTVIMGAGAKAPHGWACSANILTVTGDGNVSRKPPTAATTGITTKPIAPLANPHVIVIHQSGTTTTSATFTGTADATDPMNFFCVAY